MQTLRERREALRLTQQEVADRIGTTKTYWSEIERGHITLPKLETRQAICRVLGMRHIELLVVLGVLADYEVPGFSPNGAPAPDPQMVARHTWLDQIDLSRNGRGETLDLVLEGWAKQDQVAGGHQPLRNGTRP